MARLTSAERNALPDSAFAGPHRSYPIEDASHARNAMARASQHASPELEHHIAARVHGKYPGIGKGLRHRTHPDYPGANYPGLADGGRSEDDS
jgi:hypothetical protein